MSNVQPQQTFSQYKVRAFSLIKGKHKNYGFTLPKNIAESNLNIKFNIDVVDSDVPITINPGKYIIFKSGLDLAQLKKEIDKYDITKYQ